MGPPPPGAYTPGTQLTVGSHEVEIEKYISEGGFAHVYTCHVKPPVPGQPLACLKRVAVPDKIYLNLLRAEVDAMQRLRGCPNIVQYIDSHAERQKSASPGQTGETQGYEVFLLMEYCSGGGLIDFMNTRLRDQLREYEVLKIMHDVTLGVAQMHYLQPPLIHRDLKIENVLVSGDGNYELCDFGSASPPLRVPKTPQEARILEDDIQHHTTLQYRSPEMIDIALGFPIDEKSDIWALGVFLYKLCYYTTPFERPGQTLEQLNATILSAQFAIPPRPAYSERLRNMIRVLLAPNPAMRPNVFQVLQEVCAMRGIECPLPDIYHGNIHRAPAPAQPEQPILPVQPRAHPVHVPSVPSMAVSPSVPPHVQPVGVIATAPQSAQVSQTALPMPVRPVRTALSQSSQPQQLQKPPLPPRTGPALPQRVSRKPAGGRPQPFASEEYESDEEDIAARFPPIDVLNIQQPQQETRRGSLPLIDLSATERTSAASHAPTPAPQTQIQAPKQQPKTSQVATGAGDYPMPRRPRAAPPVDDDDITTTAKLPRILTGLNERSSTVVLDSRPPAEQLNSVDFLRTLGGDGSGRPPSRGVHRAASAAKLKPKPKNWAHNPHGHHHHSRTITALFGRRSSVLVSDEAGQEDFDGVDSDSYAFAPTTSTTEPQSSSVSEVSDSDQSENEFDFDQAESAARRSVAGAEEGRGYTPDDSGYEDGEEEASPGFRPSNTIQQRVQAFLNSQNFEQPAARTARGYGKFVDEQVEAQSLHSVDSGHSLGQSRSTPTLVSRPHSYVSPPRPLSTKPLLRSHSDESLGASMSTSPPLEINSEAQQPKPRPKPELRTQSKAHVGLHYGKPVVKPKPKLKLAKPQNPAKPSA